MKFSEYPKLGLIGTIAGVVIVMIIFGALLFGIWIYLPNTVAQKIMATIVIVFCGGGLIVGLAGGYKLLHQEVFFSKAEEK